MSYGDFFKMCPECGLTSGLHAFGCPAYDDALDLYRREIARWNPIPAAYLRPGAATPERQSATTPWRATDFSQYAQADLFAEADADAEEILGAPADAINPAHYRSHPSGVECIDITEHYGFCVGNAIKYLWRADLKHETPVDDLKKAIWYIEREIEKRGRVNA